MFGIAVDASFLTMQRRLSSNKWFRTEPLDYPVLSLSLYLKASAILFLTVTTWLLLFMKEVCFRSFDSELHLMSLPTIIGARIARSRGNEHNHRLQDDASNRAAQT